MSQVIVTVRPEQLQKPRGGRDEKKVVLFAKRDIQPGEELAYDYQFEFEPEDKKIPCYCGAVQCRGSMN